MVAIPRAGLKRGVNRDEVRGAPRLSSNLVLPALFPKAFLSQLFKGEAAGSLLTWMESVAQPCGLCVVGLSHHGAVGAESMCSSQGVKVWLG